VERAPDQKIEVEVAWEGCRLALREQLVAARAAALAPTAVVMGVLQDGRARRRQRQDRQTEHDVEHDGMHSGHNAMWVAPAGPQWQSLW